MLVVGGVLGDEAPLLSDHQEQESVDEAEELRVEVSSGQLAGKDAGAKVLIAGVREEAVGKDPYRFLDAIAEMVADAAALLDGDAAVLFEQTLRRIFPRSREPGAVEEAVEERKVGELLAFEDRFEVELDVGQAAEELRVTQDAEGLAVGHHAPEVLGAVQVVLDKRVRRETGPAGFGATVEGLAAADDMDGWGLLVGAGAVRDGVGMAVGLGGLGLVRQVVVAEQTEERDHPLVAGDAGCWVGWVEAFEAALEGAPMVLGAGPDSGDFVGEVCAWLEAEVGRLLALGVAAGDLVEEVGGEEAAFELEAGEGDHRATPLGMG